MKKLLLIVLCFPLLTLAQQTYVPDNNFEAYLEANNMGNGIANDDYVTTANISGVTEIKVSRLNIADLTGIEDFTALTKLDCYKNQLTSLDLSNNTALTYLSFGENQLTKLDVRKNTDLTFLNLAFNKLTKLDVRKNTALISLFCAYNELTSLDLTKNTALTRFSCRNNKFDCDALKAKYGL